MYIIVFILSSLYALAPAQKGFVDQALGWIDENPENPNVQKKCGLEGLLSILDIQKKNLNGFSHVGEGHQVQYYVDFKNKSFIKDIEAWAGFSESAVVVIIDSLQKNMEGRDIQNRIKKMFAFYTLKEVGQVVESPIVKHMLRVILEKNILLAVEKWILKQTEIKRKKYIPQLNYLKTRLPEDSSERVTVESMKSFFFTKPIFSWSTSGFRGLVFLGEYLDAVKESFDFLFNKEESLIFEHRILSLLVYYSNVNDMKQLNELIQELKKRDYHLLAEKFIFILTSAPGIDTSQTKMIHLIESLKVLNDQSSDNKVHFSERKGGFVYVEEKSYKGIGDEGKKETPVVHFVHQTELKAQSVELDKMITRTHNQLKYENQIDSGQNGIDLRQLMDTHKKLYQCKEIVEKMNQEDKELFLKNIFKKLLPQIRGIHSKQMYHMDFFAKNILIDIDENNPTVIKDIVIIDLDTMRPALEGGEGYYLDLVSIVDIVIRLLNPERLRDNLLSDKNFAQIDEKHMSPTQLKYTQQFDFTQVNWSVSAPAQLEAFLNVFPIQKYVKDPTLIRFLDQVKLLIYQKKLDLADLKGLESLLEEKENHQKEENSFEKKEGESVYFKYNDRIEYEKGKGIAGTPLFKLYHGIASRLVYPVYKEESKDLKSRYDDLWEYDLSFLDKSRSEVEVNPIRSLASVVYSERQHPSSQHILIPACQHEEEGYHYKRSGVKGHQGEEEVIGHLLRVVQALNERDLLYLDPFEVNILPEKKEFQIFSINPMRVFKNKYASQYNLYRVVEWLVQRYSSDEIKENLLVAEKKSVKEYHSQLLESLENIIQKSKTSKQTAPSSKVLFLMEDIKEVLQKQEQQEGTQGQEEMSQQIDFLIQKVRNIFAINKPCNTESVASEFTVQEELENFEELEEVVFNHQAKKSRENNQLKCYQDEKRDVFIKDIKMTSVFSEAGVLLIIDLLKKGYTGAGIYEEFIKMSRYFMEVYLKVQQEDEAMVEDICVMILRAKVIFAVKEWVKSQKEEEREKYQEILWDLRETLPPYPEFSFGKLMKQFFFSNIKWSHRSCFNRLILLGEYLDAIDLSIESSIFSEEMIENLFLAYLCYYHAINDVSRQNYLIQKLKNSKYHLWVEKITHILAGTPALTASHSKMSHMRKSLDRLNQVEKENQIKIQKEVKRYSYIKQAEYEDERGLKQEEVSVHFVHQLELSKGFNLSELLNGEAIHKKTIDKIKSNESNLPENQKKMYLIKHKINQMNSSQKEILLKNLLLKLIHQVKGIHRQGVYHADLFCKNIRVILDEEDPTIVKELFVVGLDTMRSPVKGENGYYFDLVSFINVMIGLFAPNQMYSKMRVGGDLFNMFENAPICLDYFLIGFPLKSYIKDESLVYFFEHIRLLIYQKKLSLSDLDELESYLKKEPGKDLEKKSLPPQTPMKMPQLIIYPKKQEKIMRLLDGVEEKSVFKKNLDSYVGNNEEDNADNNEESNEGQEEQNEPNQIKALVRYEGPIDNNEGESEKENEGQEEQEGVYHDVWEYDRSFLSSSKASVKINPYRSFACLEQSARLHPEARSSLIPTCISNQEGYWYDNPKVVVKSNKEVLWHLIKTVQALNERGLLYLGNIQVNQEGKGIQINSINPRKLMKNKYAYKYNIYLVVEWFVKTYLPKPVSHPFVELFKTYVEKTVSLPSESLHLDIYYKELRIRWRLIVENRKEMKDLSEPECQLMEDLMEAIKKNDKEENLKVIEDALETFKACLPKKMFKKEKFKEEDLSVLDTLHPQRKQVILHLKLKRNRVLKKSA